MVNRNVIEMAELLRTYRYADRLEVGVDEAGYGSFYGRVYAAAVVWPHDFNHPLIRDSKRLSAHQREVAYDLVVDHAIAYGISYREAREIDQSNIREADISAMHSAITACHIVPDVILVDGISFHPYSNPLAVGELDVVDHDLVVKGDSLYCCIAAASILAKVSRDRWIAEEVVRDAALERYGMPRNQGYGSQQHRDAIAQWGLSAGHRQRGYGAKFVTVDASDDQIMSDYDW